MLSSAILALVSAITVLAVPAESSGVTQPLSANLSCTSDQTECLLGCCPYAHAECCSDGFECCQHGQTCIPIIGICIGLVGEGKDLSLMSSKATPVENILTDCPSGTTTCGPGFCCPFPNAVCCSDREHCCPSGYRCDIPGRQCVKVFDNKYSVIDLPATTDMRSFESVKTVKKDPYKSCPGGARQCPSYMSCCMNDEGSWGCCPNPSSPLYNKGTKDCCTTWYGYVCCPDLMPFCTFIGCI